MTDARDTPADLWKATLLADTATVGEAIRNLEDSQQQIVLVLATDGSLAGTITDGDIRRGLLRGFDLSSSIGGLIHRNPLVVPPDLDLEFAIRIMQANDIRQIPVVNDQRMVVGLHTMKMKHAPALKPNVMVIMAGGQGKRLRPYTENCPKPMLLVAGKPMLEHIIERAISENFRRFIISTHYLGHMIEEYFGDGSRFDVDICYLREEAPLGTAGALGLMDPRPELPILVTNGDVLCDISYGDLLDFHNRHKAMATMAVRIHEWQHPFGVVNIDGVDIVGFEEKPISRSHINAGVYVLMPEALDEMVAGDYCDMPTLFALLQDKGARTIAYPMHEPWLDVGRADDLVHARANLEAAKSQ
ncbi:MAG TPA: nucleotidyltransferase family protein [Rhodocyclaceae bacterium]|jgi:dTDP-glucose pyrophosphorylase